MDSNQSVKKANAGQNAMSNETSQTANGTNSSPDTPNAFSPCVFSSENIDLGACILEQFHMVHAVKREVTELTDSLPTGRRIRLGFEILEKMQTNFFRACAETFGYSAQLEKYYDACAKRRVEIREEIDATRKATAEDNNEHPAG